MGLGNEKVGLRGIEALTGVLYWVMKEVDK